MATRWHWPPDSSAGRARREHLRTQARRAPSIDTRALVGAPRAGQAASRASRAARRARCSHRIAGVHRSLGVLEDELHTARRNARAPRAGRVRGTSERRRNSRTLAPIGRLQAARRARPSVDLPDPEAPHHAERPARVRTVAARPPSSAVTLAGRRGRTRTRNPHGPREGTAFMTMVIARLLPSRRRPRAPMPRRQAARWLRRGRNSGLRLAAVPRQGEADRKRQQARSACRDHLRAARHKGTGVRRRARPRAPTPRTSRQPRGDRSACRPAGRTPAGPRV